MNRRKEAVIRSAAGILLAGVLCAASVPAGAFAAETASAAEQTTAEAAAAEQTAAGAEDSASGSTAAAKTEEITVKLGYEHDPMENPKAAQDIIVNRDAVYGYSPSPLSTRLKDFVDYIDWTNEAEVEEARSSRIRYYETEEVLYQMIEEMSAGNKSIEEIARAVSQKRNELRLDAYIGDPDGLARVKKSNLDTYGNENGPTIEYLYDKYGSWEAVLQKALSSNPGMDACLGLYDDFYEFYSIEEKVTLKAQKDAVSTDAATGIKTYKVLEGDNLWKIAQKVYGDGTKWEAIYKSNTDKLSDPSELKVGMELVIPEVTDTEKKTGAASAKASDAASTSSTAAAAGSTAAEAAGK